MEHQRSLPETSDGLAESEAAQGMQGDWETWGAPGRNGEVLPLGDPCDHLPETLDVRSLGDLEDLDQCHGAAEDGQTGSSAGQYLSESHQGWRIESVLHELVLALQQIYSWESPTHPSS